MESRRNFIKKASTMGIGLSLMPNFTFGMSNGINEDKLKIGLIGVGLRGTNHLENLLLRKDIVINAICD
ncbi:MAG: gfo/Idh/MocA family oxidoreductase, partial [Flavobacteriales bacterium]